MVGILACHETKRRDLAVALDQPGQKGGRATHTGAGLILGDPDLEWSSGDLTPCMPCSFGLFPHPRSGIGAPAQWPASSDRDCPLDTAGDRYLWHVGGTADENDDVRT
jgi:hypothetical protein